MDLVNSAVARQSRRHLWPVVATALSLSACGGGGDTPAGPGPGLSIASNGAVTVPAGGSATSTITIARTGGFEGTVTLALSGQPAVVTGVITPSTVPAGTTTATIAWNAVASATVGAYTITVQATASGVPATSTTIALSVSTRPPAAIAVVAGDNQTVTSGSPVPVAPRVVVRDAGGQPVAGVSVTFSRDSGSSQLTDSIRVTAADGIAQLGEWLPGPGRNVLRATAGALAPVRFRAEGTGTMTIGDQTIPSSGGTLTVSRPGDPLNGLQITVPAQAYAQPLRAVVQYGEPAPVPGRAGTTAVTPPITLSGNRAGLANRPLTMRIPARVARTAFAVAVIRNRTTGAYETVPAVVVDSATVMVVLESFDGALIGATPTATSRAPSNVKQSVAALAAKDAEQDLQPYALQMIIGAVPYEELTKELDTGYRPAVDNWEFDQLMSKVNPWNRYRNGLALAAAWYFDHFKSSRGALRGRFQKAPGVDVSNVQGIRLANELDMNEHIDAMARYAGSLVLMADVAKIPEDSVKLLLIKAAMYQTGRPQVLHGKASGDLISAELLVYHANGNVFDVTLGTSTEGAANTGTITYANGTLSALLFSIRDFDSGAQVPVRVADYFITGQSGHSAAKLNGLWQDVFAERVGTGKYPSWHLASTAEPRIADDTIWIAEDSVRFWLECACEYGFEPENGIIPTDKMASASIWFKEGGAWTPWEKAIRGKGIRASETNDGREVGLAIAERLDETYSSFLDWTVGVIKVRRLTVTPAASTKPADTKFTLTADISRQLPPGAVWEWELGDGRKLTSNTKMLEVEYPPPASGEPTTYTIKARIKKDGKAWASGRTTVTIEATPFAAWAITTITDGDGLFDNGFPQGAFGDVLRRPTAGIIIPETVGGGTELRLRVRRAGVWPLSECCPVPAYNSALEQMLSLGTNPATTNAFGPYFADWALNVWSQSSTSLTSGTMTGRSGFSTHTYNLKNIGSQVGPEVGIQISATRAGTQLTGTITLTGWFTNEATGQVDGGPEAFRFPFTAVRIR